MAAAIIEAAVREFGLPPFRVRSAVRELSKVGLLKAVEDKFQVISEGIERLEDH